MDGIAGMFVLCRELSEEFSLWFFFPEDFCCLRYSLVFFWFRFKKILGFADVMKYLCCNGYWMIHPQKLTWNLEMMVSNRNLLFQGSIFRFHVCFGGCISCNTSPIVVPTLPRYLKKIPVEVWVGQRSFQSLGAFGQQFVHCDCQESERASCDGSQLGDTCFQQTLRCLFDHC